MPAVSAAMKKAILDERTRVRACGQLSDQMRLLGCNYHQSVKLIQDVFVDAGQVSPSNAAVDAWLSEADDSESAS